MSGAVSLNVGDTLFVVGLPLGDSGEFLVDQTLCFGELLLCRLQFGGELFAQINEAEKVEEKYAATIMQQLLYAIAYLHDRRIFHRNVRPDNFLFAEKSKDSEIKLIDFGFSWSYSRRSLASITELQGITATADGLDVGDRKEN